MDRLSTASSSELYIKDGEFLDQINDCQVFKEELLPFR
jgi:hypothetical protein